MLLKSFYKSCRNKQPLERERQPVNKPLSFLSKEKITTCAPTLLDAKGRAQEHALINVPRHNGTEELRFNHKLYKSSFQNVGTCFTACTTGTVSVIQTSFAGTMLDLGAMPQEREKMPKQLFFHY